MLVNSESLLVSDGPHGDCNTGEPGMRRPFAADQSSIEGPSGTKQSLSDLMASNRNLSVFSIDILPESLSEGVMRPA